MVGVLEAAIAALAVGTMTLSHDVIRHPLCLLLAFVGFRQAGGILRRRTSQISTHTTCGYHVEDIKISIAAL